MKYVQEIMIILISIILIDYYLKKNAYILSTSYLFQTLCHFD